MTKKVVQGTEGSYPVMMYEFTPSEQEATPSAPASSTVAGAASASHRASSEPREASLKAGAAREEEGEGRRNGMPNGGGLVPSPPQSRARDTSWIQHLFACDPLSACVRPNPDDYE